MLRELLWRSELLAPWLRRPARARWAWLMGSGLEGGLSLTEAQDLTIASLRGEAGRRAQEAALASRGAPDPIQAWADAGWLDSNERLRLEHALRSASMPAQLLALAEAELASAAASRRKALASALVLPYLLSLLPWAVMAASILYQ